MKKKKRKITIRSAKNKAVRMQNEIAKKISELTGIPYGRDRLIQGREMGQPGTDVKLIGKAKELFNFAVEAKDQMRWSIIPWIKQAQNNIGDFDSWLLFCKRSSRLKEERVSMKVIMEADTFFNILKQLNEVKKEKRKSKNEF